MEKKPSRLGSCDFNLKIVCEILLLVCFLKSHFKRIQEYCQRLFEGLKIVCETQKLEKRAKWVPGSQVFFHHWLHNSLLFVDVLSKLWVTIN